MTTLPIIDPIIAIWSRPVDFTSDTALNVYFVEFDVAKIRGESFEILDIHCPPNIAVSVPKRRAEYLSGRLAAKLALCDLGISGTPVLTGFAREPVWPVGVIGSISHTDGLAVAVALRGTVWTGVGIDVEELVDEQDIDALNALVFTQEELRYFQECADNTLALFLKTIVFSAKESFFKAVYAKVQRFISFNEISLHSVDLTKRFLRFRIEKTLSATLACESEVMIHFLDLADGRVITACLLQVGHGL